MLVGSGHHLSTFFRNSPHFKINVRTQTHKLTSTESDPGNSENWEHKIILFPYINLDCGISLPLKNWHQQTQHLFLFQLILKQDIMKYSIKDFPSDFQISTTIPDNPLAVPLFILFIAHCTSTSILCTEPIT